MTQGETETFIKALTNFLHKSQCMLELQIQYRRLMKK